MTILIDNRENPQIFSFAKELGMEFEKVNLPVGDIVFEPSGIIVERKTQSDFHQSIFNQHLQKQLQQMNCAHPILIISGSFNAYRDALRFRGIYGWSNQHYHGAIASLHRSYPSLRIYEVESDYDLMLRVKKLIEKIDDGKIVSIYDTELLRNKVTEEDMKVKLLMNFHGYGSIIAKKLLEKNKKVRDEVTYFLETMKSEGVYK